MLNILFHKGFVDEIDKGNYSGTIKINNDSTRIACEVFDAGFSLLSNYEKEQFYDLPNPENYKETEKSDIEETNSVYTAASVFCLMHEYAHHYYRHVDYYSDTQKSKKEELIADAYAINKIRANFSNEKHESYKFGIIAALASLILMNESLTDQGNHPDLDTRLNHAVKKFDLGKTDIFWALVCLVFSIWSKKYDKGLIFPPICGYI